MKLELTAIAIPKQYSLPLIVALNIAILVASYFLVFNGLFREKGALAGDLAKAEQERSSLTAIQNNLKNTRAEYTRLAADLQEMMKQMPEEKEVPNLLRQISTTAQGARIKIKYFAPKEVQPKDFYAELPFDIKYEGPYHGLGYFFDGIRNMERIVHVTNFSLEAKGNAQKPVLEGSCLAKTYVFQKDGAKAKTDGNKEKKNEPDKKDKK